MLVKSANSSSKTDILSSLELVVVVQVLLFFSSIRHICGMERDGL